LIVLVGFLLSGFATIEPNEVGVIRVFGRIVGTAEQGLAYTWPFPIGSIEKLPKARQQIAIGEFWMNETAEEKTQKLDQRPIRSQGLRPMWDGAVLTGDRNLLHLKLICIYEISDAKKYKECFVDPQEAILSILCGAVNRAAAVETADGLMRSDRIKRFRENVARIAQERLDAVGAGIWIAEVQTTDATWPLRALSDYKQVAKAVSEKEQKINEARAEAQSILTGAAGSALASLVGPIEYVIGEFGRAPGQDENLIGRYIEARNELEAAAAAAERTRQAGDKAQAKRLQAQADALAGKATALLAQIDGVLVSSRTEGEASSVIRQARTYRDATKQRLESWHRTFLDLARECKTKQSTAFLFQRKWAEAREEILGSPTVEKFTLPPGKEKQVLHIPRDPNVAKSIMLESIRQGEDQGRTGQPRR